MNMEKRTHNTELPARSEGAASSVFIDCTEHGNYVKKLIYPKRPHCDHGEWTSNGPMWKSPTYTTWVCILNRTRYRDRPYQADNPKMASYEGVSIGWNTFDEFLEAMGRRPSRDHTIDRIDPEGDYTTENCQWLPAHLNYSKGGRQAARQNGAAMIERMQDELRDLETELLKEGIEINE